VGSPAGSSDGDANYREVFPSPIASNMPAFAEEAPRAAYTELSAELFFVTDVRRLLSQ